MTMHAICMINNKVPREIKVLPGDIVMTMLHVLIGNSNKLSPKFTCPYKIFEVTSRNKYKIQNLETGEMCIRHVDDLKKIYMTETKMLISHDEESNKETETEDKD